jgi:hypothetical protein
MKQILSVMLTTIVVMIFTTITSYAGQLDSVKCSNGWVIKAGDTLKIGVGTRFDKTFAFIHTNPNLLTTEIFYLGSSYAGFNVIVKKVNERKFKGAKKIELTVGAGNILNNFVEIEQAIEAGEILPPIEYRKKVQPSVIIQNNTSVADELVKLKKLLDDGILSNDEFEVQKKKLLEK